MNLYLVRHAIAEERDQRRWPDDALRPLTTPGRRRFERAAAGLRRLGVEVDVLLTSPYVRAWATAVILSAEAGWPAPIVLDAARPRTRLEHTLAELSRIAEQRSSIGEGRAIALVGHEPDLGQLASLLLTGAPNTLWLRWRKGGVARLECDPALLPGSATLEEYLPPRMLRGIAGSGKAKRGTA